MCEVGINDKILIKNLKRKKMISKNVLHRNFYLNGDYGVDFIACQRKLMREGSAGVNNNL